MFTPIYTINSKIIHDLMRIDRVQQTVLQLPLTPAVLRSLRETARLYTTHYSTMIEGNKLNVEQIQTAIMDRIFYYWYGCLV